MISSIHFIRPDWLWGIIPIFAIILFLWKSQTKNSAWEKVCDKHLLDHLLISTKRKSLILPLILLSTGWSIAIIALAGPSFSKTHLPVYQKLDSKIILLDLSPAMNAGDIKPSRLTRAKYKIKEILKNSKEGQVGLVVFADEPYMVSPLTNDAKTIMTMMPNLTTEIMPTKGQNIGRALNFAAKMMEQAGVEKGRFILITPGPVHVSDQTAAQRLSEKGYSTSILGIGSEEGAPLAQDEGDFLKDDKGNILFSHCDKCGLQKLAKQGQGLYVDFTNTNADVEIILNDNQSLLAAKEDSNDNQLSERQQDDGLWFVYLLLPLTLLSFRRGWLG